MNGPAGPTLRSLYVCYLSLEDPLVETQVIAYLEGLARCGHTIHLLTYETTRDRSRLRAWRRSLAKRGIAWRHLRYHKRFSLPATIYDAVLGMLFGTWLVARHRLQAVHARSHVAAATALVVCRLTGAKLIFDIRGLMAEEYVDAGRWRQNGLPFRLTKWIERRGIERATAIVVLTERVRRLLFGEVTAHDVTVIPCCANLRRLCAGDERRSKVRQALGLAGSTVLVYVGKFTGWYLEEEMVAFFRSAHELISNLHFLVITQSAPSHIVGEFQRQDVRSELYTVTRVPPARIGEYLAAADAALAFIEPAFSKISSSPTKIGEYLGAGLPVVCTSGVGDVDDLVQSDVVGVLLASLDDSAYRNAARTLAALIADNATAGRCRAVAEEHLSLDGIGIPAYERLYRRVALACEPLANESTVSEP